MAEVDQLAIVARQRLEPRGRRSRRRSPTRSRRRAARAGCRAPRGRSRRRSRAWRAPGGSGSRRLRPSAAMARHRAGRQPGKDFLGGRQVLPAAIEPAGQRSIAARGRLRLQPLEHVEVLPLDDRPVVVVAEELAAVAAERAAQPAVLLDRLAAFRRTPAAFRSTARRCCECIGPSARRIAVGEHRTAERPRFERHHRQALEVRRHDQQRRRPPSRRTCRRRRGSRDGGSADARESAAASCRSARATACRRIVRDSPGRSRTAPCSPCSRRSGRRRPRTVRGCCTSGGSGRLRVAAARPSRCRRRRRAPARCPTTAWIIARSSGELYMTRADAAEQRLENRQADRRVALGGRHENRPSRGGARAVDTRGSSDS